MSFCLIVSLKTSIDQYWHAICIDNSIENVWINMMSTQRYYDLDLLRASLMIWGVFVHTGTLNLAASLDVWEEVSALVRMESFMILSGFFSALLLCKKGFAKTVKQRVISLGIPLAVVCVIINPIVNWLIFVFHDHMVPFSYHDFLVFDFSASKAPNAWHLQLWFLIPLMIYLPLLNICAKTLARVADLQGFRSNVTWTVLTVVPAASFASRLFYEFILEDSLPDYLLFISRETLYYFPFYCLGILLWFSDTLKEKLFRPNVILLTLGVSSYLLFTLSAEIITSKPAYESLKLIVEALFALALSNVLMSTFRKWFSKPSETATTLSGAAYSVFLLHLLLVYGLAYLFGVTADNGSAYHAYTIIFLTLLLSLASHKYLIDSNPLLRFFLNGR